MFIIIMTSTTTTTNNDNHLHHHHHHHAMIICRVCRTGPLPPDRDPPADYTDRADFPGEKHEATR